MQIFIPDMRMENDAAIRRALNRAFATKAESPHLSEATLSDYTPNKG